jgi:hypothetical protein
MYIRSLRAYTLGSALKPVGPLLGPCALTLAELPTLRTFAARIEDIRPGKE